MNSTQNNDLIGGWRVVEEAGEGCVGRSFVVCRDDAPEATYVLKILRDDKPELAKDVNEKEAARLRTGMEKTPDRLPALIETGEWNGLPFFVMEKIEDVDYPIPDEEYRAFCVEAFRALSELHTWLYHCDLTPSHLGWKNGKLCFIDLDNAHTPDEASEDKDCIGTDPYIAPEVASQGKLSRQADCYSLGMILIERCPKKLRDCFEPVLRECLRPEPGDRPPSAAVFAERLRTCKPPHHRFKAVAKWAAVALIIISVIYGTTTYVNYVQRRSAIRERLLQALAPRH